MFVFSLVDYIERGKIRTLSSSRKVVKAVFSSFGPSTVKQPKEKSLGAPKVTPESTALLLSHFCLFASTCVCCIHVYIYYIFYIRERRNVK